MGRLASVNVGLPRDIAWRGKTVHTGIWKAPVAGPCRVAQAATWKATGKATSAATAASNAPCFVYQIESYRYWQERLGRSDFVSRAVRRELHGRGIAGRRGLHRRPLPDRHRAVRGHPAPDDVLPGRHPHGRAADGGAADFQRAAGLLLSRPRRRRCHRRRRRRFASRKDPERMTVAVVNSLLYSNAHPRDLLERALRIPALSPGLAAVVRGAGEKPGRRPRRVRQRRLDAVADRAHARDPAFAPLKVVRKQPRMRRCRFLRAGAGGRTAAHAADRGSVRRPSHAPEVRTGRRCSAAIRFPALPSEQQYRISVKVEPHGAGGTYLGGERSRRRRARRERAARQLHLAAARRPGGAAERGNRRDARARDAARAGGERDVARGLVVARRARRRHRIPSQPRRGSFSARSLSARSRVWYSNPTRDDREGSRLRRDGPRGRGGPRRSWAFRATATSISAARRPSSPI